MYGKTGYETKSDYDRARYLRAKEKRERARPIDPILLLSELEKAYIAGLVDGEGSIHMTKRDIRRTAYPYVCITMTHKGVIEWLAEKFGNTAMYIAPSQERGFKNPTRPAYSCRLGGKRAKLLCKVLTPYLKVKSKHAKVLARYPGDARFGPGIKIEETGIDVVRERLKVELTALNNNRYQRRLEKKGANANQDRVG